MHIGRALTATLRTVRREPVVPSVVVLTLALAIGVSTAMFSVIDALLIRPLPFPIANRLVEIWSSHNEADGLRESRFGAAGLRELRARTEIFSAVEGYQFGFGTLTGVAEPRTVSSPQVTPGLLSMLGAVPVAGRLLTEDDGRAAVPSVLISESLWRGAFGSDPSIEGRTLKLDDVEYAVVGVLPAGFRFPEAKVDVWRMLPEEPPVATARPRGARLTLGVLAPGVTRELADERLRALSRTLEEAGTLPAGRVLATGRLIQETAAERYRPALYAMLGATLLVLLVAAINVTNLLLVRASSREGEFAVLSALGASRSSLAATMIVEGVLFGLAGGAVGVLFAQAALAAVVAIQPEQMTYLAGVTASLNPRVLAFAVAASVVTCMLVSLIPSWRASRADLASSIGRRSSHLAGSASERWQSALLSLQLGAVVVVLALAGMLTASFVRLVDVKPGYETAGVTVADIIFSTPKYLAPRAGLEFVRDVASLVEAETPDARAAYAVGIVGGITWPGASLEIAGRPPLHADDVEWIYSHVSPDLFQTIGIPLPEGRTFGDHEAETAIIINDVMARRFWDDASPIGSRIRFKSEDPWRTVVGVASDVKHLGLADERGAGMEIYLPFFTDQRLGTVHVVVRSSSPIDLSGVLRARIRQLDPDLPASVVSLDERIAESRWQPEFFLRLAIAFSLAALLVAGVGVYGAAAYRATRRRREIAVRIAVGATRTEVARLVLRRGMAAAVVGAIGGLAGAFLAARSVTTMLYETPPTDPAVLVGATLVLAGLVIVASLVPAIRASRLDPMTVLKSE